MIFANNSSIIMAQRCGPALEICGCHTIFLFRPSRHYRQRQEYRQDKRKAEFVSCGVAEAATLICAPPGLYSPGGLLPP